MPVIFNFYFPSGPNPKRSSIVGKVQVSFCLNNVDFGVFEFRQDLLRFLTLVMDPLKLCDRYYMNNGDSRCSQICLGTAIRS